MQTSVHPSRGNVESAVVYGHCDALSRVVRAALQDGPRRMRLVQRVIGLDVCFGIGAQDRPETPCMPHRICHARCWRAAWRRHWLFTHKVTPAAQEAAGLLPEGGLAAVAATIKHGLHVHLVAGALTADTEAVMRRLHGSLRAAAADAV